jgi:hypothetical protein
MMKFNRILNKDGRDKQPSILYPVLYVSSVMKTPAKNVKFHLQWSFIFMKTELFTGTLVCVSNPSTKTELFTGTPVCVSNTSMKIESSQAPLYASQISDDLENLITYE